MMNPQEQMIESQLKGRDIYDQKVLNAMRQIDRSLFVPDHLQQRAFEDVALPIGQHQTISQPYIVAYMAQCLDLQPNDKVLEVGTGCGYNAAILSRLVNHVYSIEIIEWLAQLADQNLQKAGVKNVAIRLGDGYQGWDAHAPFDKIMITAATLNIPQPLKKQLGILGKMVVPVGSSYQKLTLLTRIEENVFDVQKLIPVRFVPMTGKGLMNLEQDNNPNRSGNDNHRRHD